MAKKKLEAAGFREVHSKGWGRGLMWIQREPLRVIRYDVMDCVIVNCKPS